MTRDEPNPYRPPEAGPEVPRPPGRFKPVVTFLRVIVGLWGLFILAGPTRSAPLFPSRSAEIAFKALGVVLFLVAVFPFGSPRKRTAEDRAETTEDL